MSLFLWKFFFMKKGLFVFLFLVSSLTFSQTLLKGKITTQQNQPLEGASVYFNNTTVGTITDTQGNFQLNCEEGNYTLVVSFLGYKVEQLPINISKTQENITIKLEEENNVLDEVVIQKTTYDNDWKYNLFRFKQSFLGRAKLASECKILNPKVLHFNFNPTTGTLTAYAKEPLRIKHNGLGYLITYDLVEYTLERQALFFSGFARYENLRKSTKGKWNRNRLEAYNGSKMHFFRSLLAKNSKEEGFVINQFKRVPNPDRPSEKK